MRNIILSDDKTIHTQLLPLTFTRPISELLCGMTTIRSKWERLLPGEYFYYTTDYLSEIFHNAESIRPNDLIIASHIIPDSKIAEAINALGQGEALLLADGHTAAKCGPEPAGGYKTIPYPTDVRMVTRPYDLFTLNDEMIREDFDYERSKQQPQPISESCTVIGDKNMVHIEAGATAEGVIFNTTHGPIYIGKGAEVMEGSCLRGPIAILPYSTVNMGTKIYGATTIGEHCKVGGELNNVVMHPYSNKAHDGFLGNAVIGSWCNLGAGSVASNLKNDYTEIKLWDYASRRFLRTGLQFCGLIMGDHSKAGINTMFNTATVTGVGVNIHGSGYPRNFVASFTEGSTAGFTDVPPTKFFSIAERVMARRGVTLTNADRRLYETLYEITETYK